jgi:hypothetical protein
MTQVKLITSIFGDSLDVEALSEIIGLSPTAFWKKGDQIPNRRQGLLRKETCWEYSFEFIQTLFLDDVYNLFIELIQPNIALVEKYIRENRLETKIFIIIEIINNEEPAIYITKNLMEMLLKLNGEIDIDLYVL